jgi:thiol-disulfide isomerase/thioredoxin
MLLALLLLSTAGCKSGRAPGEGETAGSTAQRAGGAPRFVRGPTDGAPIAPFLRQERRSALAAGNQVLVYVGATWCEPCQHFHDAVRNGQLDEVFPGLRLVEFDLDADRDALSAAGYTSRMIPLFAVPAEDGRASGRMVYGSIKGPTAVNDDLVPRLRSLLTSGS